MNSIRDHLKIAFCDQYLWPPTAATGQALKTSSFAVGRGRTVPLGGVVAVVLAESPDWPPSLEACCQSCVVNPSPIVQCV